MKPSSPPSLLTERTLALILAVAALSVMTRYVLLDERFNLFYGSGSVAASRFSFSTTSTVESRSSSSSLNEVRPSVQMTDEKKSPQRLKNDTVKFHIHENGANLLPGKDDLPSHVLYLSRENASSTLSDLGKVWNDDGMRVKTFEDLVRWAELARTRHGEDVVPRLWRSANRGNLHFIWPPTDRVRHLDFPASPIPGKKVEMLLLSRSPRVYYISNFISDDEIARLISFATDTKNNPYSMRQSTTGAENWNSNAGAAEVVNSRTSENAFDTSSPTAAAILKRGAELIRYGYLNGGRRDIEDGVQIVRYYTEQAYDGHYDAYTRGTPTSTPYEFDNTQPKGGNRFTTLFIYFTDGFKGGQTAFPLVPPSAAEPETWEHNRTVFGVGLVPKDEVNKHFKSPPDSWQRKAVDACYRSLSVTPKKGSAILFYNLLGDGTLDGKTVHMGCPVIDGGVKYAANVWMWSNCRYGVPCERPRDYVTED